MGAAANPHNSLSLALSGGEGRWCAAKAKGEARADVTIYGSLRFGLLRLASWDCVTVAFSVAVVVLCEGKL